MPLFPPDGTPPAVVVERPKWLDYTKLAIWVVIAVAGIGTFVAGVIRGEKPPPPDIPPPPVINVTVTGFPATVSTSPVIPAERK